LQTPAALSLEEVASFAAELSKHSGKRLPPTPRKDRPWSDRDTTTAQYRFRQAMRARYNDGQQVPPAFAQAFQAADARNARRTFSGLAKGHESKNAPNVQPPARISKTINAVNKSASRKVRKAQERRLAKEFDKRRRA